MKLSELKEDDTQLDELLPALAAKAVGSLAKGVTTGTGVGGALAKAGKAVGLTPSPGDLDDLAAVQANPMAAVKMAKDRMDQKKQIQDQIKDTEKQLNDLRKQLADLG